MEASSDEHAGAEKDVKNGSGFRPDELVSASIQEIPKNDVDISDFAAASDEDREEDGKGTEDDVAKKPSAERHGSVAVLSFVVSEGEGHQDSTEDASDGMFQLWEELCASDGKDVGNAHPSVSDTAVVFPLRDQGSFHLTTGGDENSLAEAENVENAGMNSGLGKRRRKDREPHTQGDSGASSSDDETQKMPNKKRHENSAFATNSSRRRSGSAEPQTKKESEEKRRRGSEISSGIQGRAPDIAVESNNEAVLEDDDAPLSD